MLPGVRRPMCYQSLTGNHWPTTLADRHHKASEYGPCVCKHECGSDCLNVQTSVECDDEICGNGPYCGNRQAQNGESASVVLLEPDKTGGKGWGLSTTNKLRAEEYLLEYIGEVITADEHARRTMEHIRTNPNDHSTYAAHLRGNLIIDARWKGNMARYINHSCNPNCELRKREVKGLPCAMIVATRTVGAGEELLMNYNLSTMESSRFLCLCGAPFCRGTMARASRSSSVDVSAGQGTSRIEMRHDGSLEMLHELNDIPFGSKGHQYKVPFAPE